MKKLILIVIILFSFVNPVMADIYVEENPADLLYLGSTELSAFYTFTDPNNSGNYTESVATQYLFENGNDIFTDASCLARSYDVIGYEGESYEKIDSNVYMEVVAAIKDETGYQDYYYGRTNAMLFPVPYGWSYTVEEVGGTLQVTCQTNGIHWNTGYYDPEQPMSEELVPISGNFSYQFPYDDGVKKYEVNYVKIDMDNEEYSKADAKTDYMPEEGPAYYNYTNDYTSSFNLYGYPTKTFVDWNPDGSSADYSDIVLSYENTTNQWNPFANPDKVGNFYIRTDSNINYVEINGEKVFDVDLNVFQTVFNWVTGGYSQNYDLNAEWFTHELTNIIVTRDSAGQMIDHYVIEMRSDPDDETVVHNPYASPVYRAENDTTYDGPNLSDGGLGEIDFMQRFTGKLDSFTQFFIDVYANASRLIGSLTDIIAEVFSFLPEPILYVITLGLTLSVLLRIVGR